METVCISSMGGEGAEESQPDQFVCVLRGRTAAAGTAEPRNIAHQNERTQHLLERYWGALVLPVTEKEA